MTTYIQANKHAIISSFTRSYDFSHNSINRIHLLSSICLIDGPHLNTLNHFLTRRDILNPYEDTLYIFVVVPKEYWNYEYNGKRDIALGNNIVISEITIEQLLFHTGLINKNDGMVSDLFGNMSDTQKDFSNLSKKSFFIFIDQVWSNVVLKFRLNNIDISGGSSPKRHILQTVDFRLVNFLRFIFQEDRDIDNIAYRSYKNFILSYYLIKLHSKIMN